MDGSSRQVVVSTTIEWPNGITLDFANRFVQHPLGLCSPHGSTVGNRGEWLVVCVYVFGLTYAQNTIAVYF